MAGRLNHAGSVAAPLAVGGPLRTDYVMSRRKTSPFTAGIRAVT